MRSWIESRSTASTTQLQILATARHHAEDFGLVAFRQYLAERLPDPLAPLALGFVAGVLTLLLGIGGGFILVPAMIYLLGMSARVVIGTSRFEPVYRVLSFLVLAS
jgi:uncharacterized membrane protein YfcA